MYAMKFKQNTKKRHTKTNEMSMITTVICLVSICSYEVVKQTMV